MSEECKCSNQGPGYASPEDAYKRGPREKYLFVACPHTEQTEPDRLVTVDVDPESKHYMSIVSQVAFPNIGDEVHHMGWNACSSCYHDGNAKRKFLVLPCLNSSRIYFVDTSDPTNLLLHETLEPEALFKENVSFPHTAHCLADGNIMISTLGDAENEPRGDFLLVDGKTFKTVGKWSSDCKQKPQFGYDFWYQPRCNVMISTEWGSPKHIKKGLQPTDLAETDVYGQKIYIWDWQKRIITQTIKLDCNHGLLPFEIRFLHNPESASGYFCTALGSSLYYFFRRQGEDKFCVEMVSDALPIRLSNWILPEMPAIISDIVISMNDKYLYASCWLHGEVRQYDISIPAYPVMIGQIFIGGHESLDLSDDEKEKKLYDQKFKRIRSVKGKTIDGGPQMLQLSLDGKRLYVTTSLYSIWDKQFYPNLIKSGSKMLQIDCNTDYGGLQLNTNFIVDFGELEGGPFLAHEMRYPGGDCTSDIWI